MLPKRDLGFGLCGLAIKLGADYIEPDVQMISEGYLVAIRDTTLTTLTRTTDIATLFVQRNGSYRVSDFTLTEIKTLTVKPPGALSSPDSTYQGFTPSMADHYKVPTLDEVLSFLGAHN